MRSKGSFSGRLAIVLCLGAWMTCCAQEVTVTGHVMTAGGANASSAASSVVWLVPVDPAAASAPVAPMHAVLVQKNKAFDPHLLVITRLDRGLSQPRPMVPQRVFAVQRQAI